MTENEQVQDNIEKKEEIQEQPQIETVKEEKPRNLKSEDNEVNWRKFREEREKERKAAQELAEKARQKEAETEALKKALEAVVNKPQPQQQQTYGYYENEETDEQRTQRLIAEALQKERQKQEEAQRQRDQQMVPLRLRQDMPDFDKICNAENLDYLEYKNPKLANALGSMPDSYEKWSAVYDAVKTIIPNQFTKEDQRRMEQNQLKPQANVNAMGSNDNPKRNTWKEIEAQRAANWKRMQQDSKSLG